MEYKDLTLLLPTVDRCTLFARLVQHLANNKWKGPILVADSSNTKNGVDNMKTILKHKDVLDIEYVHYSPSTPPITKWANIASRVKSEFAVFCADDDLIIPDAVLHSAVFLSEHPEYSLCHGVYLAYICNTPEVLSSGIKIVSDNYSESIEADTASERLVTLFSRYAATFYGVHRTSALNSVLIKIAETIPSSHTYGNMQELIQSCLITIHGKTKRLPILYSIRQGWPSTPGWEGLLMRSDFSTQIDAIRTCIIQALSEREDIKREDAAQLFNASFLRYLRKGIGLLPMPAGFGAYQSLDFGTVQLDQPLIQLLLKDSQPACTEIINLITRPANTGQ